MQPHSYYSSDKVTTLKTFQLLHLLYDLEKNGDFHIFFCNIVCTSSSFSQTHIRMSIHTYMLTPSQSLRVWGQGSHKSGGADVMCQAYLIELCPPPPGGPVPWERAVAASISYSVLSLIAADRKKISYIWEKYNHSFFRLIFRCICFSI